MILRKKQERAERTRRHRRRLEAFPEITLYPLPKLAWRFGDEVVVTPASTYIVKNGHIHWYSGSHDDRCNQAMLRMVNSCTVRGWPAMGAWCRTLLAHISVFDTYERIAIHKMKDLSASYNNSQTIDHHKDSKVPSFYLRRLTKNEISEGEKNGITAALKLLLDRANSGEFEYSPRTFEVISGDRI